MRRAVKKNTNTNLCYRPSAGGLAASGDVVGDRFRQARERKGLSIGEAAAVIGCSSSLLGRIEKYSAWDTADRHLVSRAADAYGVHQMWLYAGFTVPERFWPWPAQ